MEKNKTLNIIGRVLLAAILLTVLIKSRNSENASLFLLIVVAISLSFAFSRRN